MTESPEAALPEWDMTPFFPGLDSPQFEAEFKGVVEEIEALVRQFDDDAIDGSPKSESGDYAGAFERTADQLNHLLDRMRVVGAYISSFVSVDSRNARAQSLMSAYQNATIPVPTLHNRFTAWVGSIDVETLIAKSTMASGHAFALRKAAVTAAHLMSAPEEELAAELSLSGSRAWTRLHGDVSSQVTAKVPQSSENRELIELPMSAVRNLAFSADAYVREAAYEAELEAWEHHKISIAAAFNGIKGEVSTLCRRRKWVSALDESLHENHIDTGVLDAMMAAARKSFPSFRRYLTAKAKLLHGPTTERAAWFDIFAPIGDEPRAWNWSEAESFIVETFGSYSDRLRDFGRRAFDEHWIDAEPREGKRDGAFCMRVRRDESRILTNFKPSYNGVNTIAHELGHGYHNVNLADRTYLQRDTPMALAETASIFCEAIVRNAALDAADPAERMSILEASLQGACQIVVDISSRLYFEQEAFKSRADRALQPEELCSLMLQAQQDAYGDALYPDKRHGYMWAVKPHYYSTASFYNYPYMFGMLFGLGLYARYEADPEGFRNDYDDLLSSTGLADAATLANRFGIDIKSEEFWNSSLKLIERDINSFISTLS